MGGSTGDTEGTSGLVGEEAVEVRKGRILVIDDEKNSRLGLAKLLGEDGFAVSALAAVPGDLRALQGIAFDLIITDVKMPQRSGIDLLQALQASGCRTPVIVVTAHRALQDDLKTRNGQILDVLDKPLDYTALMQVIQTALGDGGGFPKVATPLGGWGRGPGPVPWGTGREGGR